MSKGVLGYVQITGEGMIDYHNHLEGRGEQASQQRSHSRVELDVIHV
jgi:hypothetical protein